MSHNLTHSDTFGNQEKSHYNAHYQTNGYHLLVAFEGLTGHFLTITKKPYLYVLF
ncbi:transposase [Listeria monocytogenes]|nr:transposase [Listeria monocytogenes]